MSESKFGELPQRPPAVAVRRRRTTAAPKTRRMKMAAEPPVVEHTEEEGITFPSAPEAHFQPVEPVVEETLPVVEDEPSEDDTYKGLSMSDAPKDGRAIWLTDGETWAPGYWRITRQFSGREARFMPFAFWAKQYMNVPMDFDPVGWAPLT